MTELTDIVQIDNNGTVQDVTVDQLLGFDLAGVEEVRGFPLAPEGVYEWKIIEWTNKNVAWTDKKTGDAKISLVLDCKLEAISCRQAKDPAVVLTDLVGLSFTEGFFISASDDLGRVKAFLVDVGMSGSGTIATLCDQSLGSEFVAPVTHRTDKNDTSKKYDGLDRTAIEPLVAAAGAPAMPGAPAATVAAPVVEAAAPATPGTLSLIHNHNKCNRSITPIDGILLLKLNVIYRFFFAGQCSSAGRAPVV